MERQKETNAALMALVDGVSSEAQWALVNAAVDVLVRSGMVERYRTQGRASVYLGWPGRSGVLRVSDHQGRAEKHILARLTFSKQMAFQRPNIHDMVAHALGTYLVKSAPLPGAPSPDSEAVR